MGPSGLGNYFFYWIIYAFNRPFIRMAKKKINPGIRKKLRGETQS